MSDVNDALRDIDVDWRRIGKDEPYWGVLTDSRFKRAALDPVALDLFYASGRSDIGGFAAAITRATGAPPTGPALDFGCGVGRLAEAMAEIVEDVVGFDISPGMLAEARSRGGRARYAEVLPAGPFGWINSYIVFQHIPSARGFSLLKDLLTRLAPGGAVSLQFTCDRAGREPAPAPPPEPGPPPAPAAGGVRGALQRLRAAPAEEPRVCMFDYDLTMVTRILRDAGVGRLTLEPTDHGGHLGYIAIGRRDAA